MYMCIYIYVISHSMYVLSLYIDIHIVVCVYTYSFVHVFIYLPTHFLSMLNLSVCVK